MGVGAYQHASFHAAWPALTHHCPFVLALSKLRVPLKIDSAQTRPGLKGALVDAPMRSAQSLLKCSWWWKLKSWCRTVRLNVVGSPTPRRRAAAEARSPASGQEPSIIQEPRWAAARSCRRWGNASMRTYEACARWLAIYAPCAPNIHSMNLTEASGQRRHSR